MGHGTQVNGVQRGITGGMTLVDGVQRKIIKGLTLVDGVQREIPFLSGVPIGDIAEGSIVYANVGGVAKEFIVVHQGKPSSLYDDSCNGTWLLMKDIYENRQWDSSGRNSYKDSTIHSYLNGTFLNLFDADIKDQIKTVKIPYVNGTGSSAVASGSSGLSAQIFLLSGYEVGWTQSTSQYFPIDGACLSFFSGSGNSDSNRIAYLDGKAAVWFLRSPNTLTAVRTWAVVEDGDNGSGTSSTSRGIRPAFILPQETLVNESFEIIAQGGHI